MFMPKAITDHPCAAAVFWDMRVDCQNSKLVISSHTSALIEPWFVYCDEITPASWLVSLALSDSVTNIPQIVDSTYVYALQIGRLEVIPCFLKHFQGFPLSTVMSN